MRSDRIARGLLPLVAGIGAAVLVAGGCTYGSEQSIVTGSIDPTSRMAHSDKLKPTENVDLAPNGTFEKAPACALADRDYSATKLDTAVASRAINAYRAGKGLKPVVVHAELNHAAEVHAKDLAKWDRISHFGSDGSNPWDVSFAAAINPGLLPKTSGPDKSRLRKCYAVGSGAPAIIIICSCPMLSTSALPSFASPRPSSRRFGL